MNVFCHKEQIITDFVYEDEKEVCERYGLFPAKEE